MIVSTELTPLYYHFMGYTFTNDSKYRANATIQYTTISWATHSKMILSTELTPLNNHFIGYTFKNDSEYRANATKHMGYTFKNDSTA